MVTLIVFQYWDQKSNSSKMKILDGHKQKKDTKHPKLTRRTPSMRKQLFPPAPQAFTSAKQFSHKQKNEEIN